MKDIKHNSFYIFILMILLSSASAQAIIFDNGSRRSKVAEAPEKIRWASRAVVSVFSPSGFVQQNNGDYLVKKFQMNSVPNSPKTDALRMLCETELYSREYRSESLKGSGVLITPEQVLLPAHLFKRRTDCKERKIVVNFTGLADIVAHEDVYHCKKLQFIRYDMNPEYRPQDHEFGSSKLDGHMDYAIIQLDRPVKDIEPARLADQLEPLKPNDRLYFVSSMRGLPQTVETADIKFISKPVVSTNASTAQGSSGGIYFNEDGALIGMHISSNPASNATDEESNCLKWVQESTETFDWDSLVHIKERGVERPFGALMLPISVLHKKLYALQSAYYQNLAIKVQEEAVMKQQQQQTAQTSQQQQPSTPASAAMAVSEPQQQQQPQLKTSRAEALEQPAATDAASTNPATAAAEAVALAQEEEAKNAAAPHTNSSSGAPSSDAAEKTLNTSGNSTSSAATDSTTPATKTKTAAAAASIQAPKDSAEKVSSQGSTEESSPRQQVREPQQQALPQSGPNAVEVLPQQQQQVESQPDKKLEAKVQKPNS